MQEIKLNKNLNALQENVVAGLSFRQAVCGGIGIILGAAVYFTATKKGFVSDVCAILSGIVVAPFAALGFVRYHGLPFEKIVLAVVKQYILTPKHLVFRLENNNYNKEKDKIKLFEDLEVKAND